MVLQNGAKLANMQAICWRWGFWLWHNQSSDSFWFTGTKWKVVRVGFKIRHFGTTMNWHPKAKLKPPEINACYSYTQPVQTLPTCWCLFSLTVWTKDGLHVCQLDLVSTTSERYLTKQFLSQLMSSYWHFVQTGVAWVCESNSANPHPCVSMVGHYI